MKMISSTSITSTSGTTLISASELATRRLRARPGAMSSPLWTFGTLRKVPFCDVQELHREIVHFRREHLHVLRQPVVIDDGRNGSDQTAGRRDQRIGDRPRHNGQVRVAFFRDA